MKKQACVITKICCVCQRERHNTEFKSNAKGRVSIKAFCFHCKEIYEGIQKGLIDEKIYKGYDYNTKQLEADHYGKVIFLQENSFEKINVDYAIRLVKQGMAHVTSSTAIQTIPGVMKTEVKGMVDPKLRLYVLERDDKKCHYCVREGNTVDHIIPRFEGGLNTPLNLVACCKECNELKSNMSRDAFIQHLKKGHYDYFTQSWKPEVKLEVENKKCRTCGETKPMKDFSKQEVNCNKCNILHNVIQLGFIQKEEIKQISLDESLLKASITQLNDVKGQELGWVKKSVAQSLIQKGFVKIKGPNSIQFLVEDYKLKRLDPTFKLTLPSEEKEKQNEKNKEEYTLFKMNKQKIRLLSFDKKEIGHITLSRAKELFKQSIVALTEDNVVKIAYEPSIMVQKYPNFSISILEKEEKVDIFTEDEKEYYSLNKKIDCSTQDHVKITNILKEAVKPLFMNKEATASSRTKVVAQLGLKELLNQYPTFLNYITEANVKSLLNESKIKMFDEHGEICAEIPNDLAIKAFYLELAKVRQENEIQLTKDVSLVREELIQLDQYLLTSSWKVSTKQKQAQSVSIDKAAKIIPMKKSNKTKKALS